MSFLDQSDIDALLNSSEAVEGGDAEGGGDVSTYAASALPANFRLEATTSQVQRLEPIQVLVTVRLAECAMNLDSVLNLNVGTIIEFERPSDAELDLMISNRSIGVGHAVKCGERFGLRVSRIEPWALRLLESGALR